MKSRKRLSPHVFLKPVCKVHLVNDSCMSVLVSGVFMKTVLFFLNVVYCQLLCFVVALNNCSDIQKLAGSHKVLTLVRIQ